MLHCSFYVFSCFYFLLLSLEPEGVEQIAKSFGIRQIKDRHGNTFSYTYNGIQHSNGAGLIFTYDNNDRIVQVDAPDGRVLNYT